MSDSNKERSTRRAAKLMAKLMDGETLDRNTAADTAEVEPAAAYRKLLVLEEEIPAVVRAGSKFRFDFTRARPVSAPVAIAASFARALGDLFGDGVHGNNLRSAADDIISRCESTDFAHIDRKLVFVTRGGDPSVVRDGGMLSDVLEGVIRSRWIQIRYQSRQQSAPTVRKIMPLSLIVCDHRFYIYALKEDRSQRVYRMSRVSDVQVTESSFPYPGSDDRFDPRKVFQNTIGVYLSGDDVENVVIKLTGEWARIAETHKWHASQNTRLVSDGVEIRWRLQLTEELTSLILSFGSAVEVIAPRSLCDEVVKEAQAFLARNSQG